MGRNGDKMLILKGTGMKMLCHPKHSAARDQLKQEKQGANRSEPRNEHFITSRVLSDHSSHSFDSLCTLFGNPGPVVSPQSILLRQVMLYLDSGSGSLTDAILLLLAMAVVRFFSGYLFVGSCGIISVFTGGSPENTSAPLTPAGTGHFVILGGTVGRG